MKLLSYARYFRSPLRLWRRWRWRTIHQGPPRTVTIDSYNGRITVDSRDNVIGKELYCFRHWERELIAEVLELLRGEGLLPPRGEGTLYDVGANIGMISTGMLRHGEFRDSVAFEPAPGNFALLQQNVAQNGLSERVVCMPYALSAEPGTLRLELSEMNFGDHRIRSADTDGAFGEASRATVDVEVRTLDECIASDSRLAGRRPALVWMDIQGHEGFFFRGARDALTAARVPVVSEFWPYGVARSGRGAEEYCGIVRELFTHFYHRVEGRWQPSPIAEIDALYARMSSPEQYCEVVLVRS